MKSIWLLVGAAAVTLVLSLGLLGIVAEQPRFEPLPGGSDPHDEGGDVLRGVTITEGAGNWSLGPTPADEPVTIIPPDSSGETESAPSLARWHSER